MTSTLRCAALLAMLGTAEASAQTPPPGPQAAPPAVTPAVTVSGGVTPGVQQVGNSTNSSKLTEYRDLQDNFYAPRLTFAATDRASGWFVELDGTNVSRNDQTILARGSRPDRWSFDISWIEVPHDLSRKAVSPYTRRSGGLLEAPGTVPIAFKKLATSAADTAGVLASDDLIAAYQRTFLAPTPLGTQTDTGHFAAAWSAGGATTIGLAYDRRAKTGTKPTYGPIGDRPPRTLNIQLAEPVDYRTNDVTIAAEHAGTRFQVRGEYLLSNFANQIDTLQWQNVYTTAPAGASYDTWDRAVGVYGVRPLPPDNRYQNFSATAGAGAPLDGRISATFAYGRLDQDAALLPYAYHVNQLAVRDLPRSSAEALIQTTSLMADYVASPADRLQVRAFYRLYDLNNDTPSDRWQYVTSDTSNLNGTVAYVNKRINVPYAWNRWNGGAEATYRLPHRNSLTFGYEREGISRDHREANTDENIIRLSWRTRAASWLNLEARYLQGWRDGGVYNNEVTHEGYWYSQSEATDNNNPALTFDNHPDMRRYDVSDRERRQVDVRANLTRNNAALSAYVRYRNEDFDSGVTRSQPLLGTGLAEQQAFSPGDQLGRLEGSRVRVGLDFFAQPRDRFSLNAFVARDLGTGTDRSLEFNENNKANPSAVATAELGPWTRASSQWTAELDDRTWNGGAGARLTLVPNRLVLAVDYAASIATVDLTYSGYGVTNWDGTPFPPNHQFAFSTPPTTRETLHVANVSVEIPIRDVTLIASYTFEKYVLEDWQQGSSFDWVEPVGADTLLRDTSRSNQWGNRLFNLGTYLAPGYSAHFGFVGFAYRF